MEINDRLFELYKNELYSRAEIFDAIDRYNASVNDKSNATACPLLLADNDYYARWPLSLTSKNYQSADVKIMIYGQETCGWGGVYSRDQSLENIIGDYNFFTSGDAFNYKGPTPFWSFFLETVKSLSAKNSDKKFGYLWNNIVKIGYAEKAGLPDDFYDDIVRPYFHGIVIKELEILKPDYIIFLTGPNYDHIIDEIFNKPQRDSLSGFEERQFCEIHIPNVKNSVRTYHPAYLARGKGGEIWCKHLDRIADEITRDINR